MDKWARRFSFKAARDLAKFLNTKNMQTQTVAIDENAENIKSTGTGLAILAGKPIVLAAHGELDISADTEGTETAWATATAYVVGDTRKNSQGIRFRCITAHTSTADDEPGFGARYNTYWEESYHGAVNAVGTTITTGYDQWFLITAKADGVLTMWQAGVQALNTTAVPVIPHYDPEKYIPVALAIIVNDSGGDLIVGTTALTGDITFYQLIGGSLLPDGDLIDQN